MIIDKDFYCSAGLPKDRCKIVDKNCEPDCGAYHRKHPTPKQFKKEYGFDYPDDGAVYSFTFDGAQDTWVAGNYRWAKSYEKDITVCACTPWGKPDDNWKP